jgi:hypothetical protein
MNYFSKKVNFCILHLELDVKGKCDSTILRLLFNTQMCSLHEVIIDVPDGLMLYKTLIPNQSITYIHLVLETIDDLYILLDGLIPNVEKVIIRLRHPRILCKYFTSEILIYISRTYKMFILFFSSYSSPKSLIMFTINSIYVIGSEYHINS